MSLMGAEHRGPPAGWYDNSDDGTGMRCWDGAAWSQHYHPPEVAPAQPKAPAPETYAGDAAPQLHSRSHQFQRLRGQAQSRPRPSASACA